MKVAVLAEQLNTRKRQKYFGFRTGISRCYVTYCSIRSTCLGAKILANASTMLQLGMRSFHLYGSNLSCLWSCSYSLHLIGLPLLMFTCDACLRRGIALTSPTAPVLPPPPACPVHSIERSVNPAFTTSRNHATLQTLRKGHHRRDLFKALHRRQMTPLVKAVRPDNPRARSVAEGC